MGVGNDILATILLGAGGFGQQMGQGLQRRQETDDDYKNSLNKLYFQQLLKQQDPLYKAQVAAMGRQERDRQQLKAFLKSNAEKELAKTEEAKETYRDTRSMAQDRLENILSKREEGGFGGALWDKYTKSIGSVLKAPVGVPLDLARRIKQTGFGTTDMPVYSKGGKFGYEGTLDEPEDVRQAREGIERLNLVEDVETASPIRQDLEMMGTEAAPASVDDWVDMEYYRLLNQAGGRERILNDPNKALRLGILESQELSPMQKQLITGLFDGTITREQALQQDPSLEYIMQVIEQLMGG